jgi:hypothetical protein
MTVGDVAANRPIGCGSIELFRQTKFTHAFLGVSNIAVAFCKSQSITKSHVLQRL